MRRLAVSVFFLLLGTLLYAQEYTVTGRCPWKQGSLLLRIYPLATLDKPLSQKVKIDHGTFTFSGSVSEPKLAELVLPDALESLWFYLENSDIKITVATANPAASPITGSHSNSQFRVMKESFVNQGFRFVKLVDSQQLYVPHIIYECRSDLQPEQLFSLYQNIDSAAFRTPHYALLTTYVERLKALTPGQRLPDFVFVDSARARVHFDSLSWNNDYHVLVFGAHWCDKCDEVLTFCQQLSHSQTRYFPIDDHPSGWNADFMDLLAIDHLPFIMLLDSSNTILARDIPYWKLPRLIPQE